MTTPDAPWVEHYQPGVPAQIELPTESLPHLFARSVREGGSHTALTFFGATTTYSELGAQVERAAEGLRRLGVRAGDRVALLLPNCPQHVVAFYAVLRLGAVVVEQNPLYTTREMAAIVADHGAKVAIVWDKAVEKLQAFPRELQLEHIIAVNLLEEFPRHLHLALSLPLPALREKREALHARTSGTTSWRSLLRHGSLDPDTPMPRVEDLAVLLYTSGTTGDPKGVMLSHYNLYANALQGAAWMKDAKDRAEVFYAVLPMFHAFGLTLYLTYGIMRQANLVLFPKFDVDMVLGVAKKLPPTIYCAVPPIYQKTAEEAAKRGVDLSSAKYCISGAMALTDDIVETWEKVSGGLLVEGYGLSESSPVALGNPFWPTRRTGTIGIPFPSTYRKVVDVEDPEREVGVGEPGELLIKGPQVTSGYWQNPEETAKVLLPDGWLRTGDIVTLDEDGFATIVDRAKELIITGGFNVSPSEVERVLREVPEIEDVAVVGAPREAGGEMVVAVVVPASGATIDEDAVRAYARENLSRYKVPKRVIVHEGELPKSMLGKVLRRQVREALPADLD